MEEKDKQTSECSYVYMVMCEDESIYTGITKDVKARMREHYFKTGKGAKYTRSRQVQRILMVWEAKSYSSAARLEYAIKRITRKQKLFLTENPEVGWKNFFPKLEGESYVPRREYVLELTELFRDKIVDKEDAI